MQPPARALRPCLWPLLAAAALLLCLADAAPGRAATPSQRITAVAAAAGLDASAGWHGRRVRRVVRAAAPSRRRTTAAWFDLAPGAGYATAQGSPAVRMLQRRLRRLGYAVGPVDGHYGPRTRSAVGWFQLKHGLHADGVAGPATQRRLQARVTGGAKGAPPRTAATDRATPPRPSGRASTEAHVPGGRRAGATPHRSPGPRRAGAGEAARSSDRWVVAGLAVAAVLAGLAGIAGLLRLRRRRGRRALEGTVVALAQPLWIAGLSPDPAIGRFAGTATAINVSPGPGADAPPVNRYRLVDEVTRRSVWVTDEEIKERRVAARHDLMRSRRRGSAATDVAARIARLQRRGLSAEAIAALLNAESVPPPRGDAAWRPASVAEHAPGGRASEAVA